MGFIALFGIAVLVPPMVYLEKRFIGVIEPGFAAFYGDLLSAGVYPGGHLSWHHFWFLAYLYLYCLVLMWLRQPAWTRWRVWAGAWVERLDTGHRVYLFAFVLLVIELPQKKNGRSCSSWSQNAQNARKRIPRRKVGARRLAVPR